jgi:intracellular multiplication protein IcmD
VERGKDSAVSSNRCLFYFLSLTIRGQTVKKFTKIAVTLSSIGLLCCASAVFAADAENLGTIATRVTESFGGIAKLISGGAFLAGVGFAMAAIFKFKAHKDNPQQIPIGTPIALMVVAGALMYLPSVYGSLGVTIFGTAATPGGLSGTTNIGG